MINWQDISSAIPALALVVAFSYYVLIIRNANRTRQAQLFMQIYGVFNTEKFMNNITEIMSWKWKDYDDFMKRYGPTTNPNAWQVFGSIAGYFEGIGILVNKRLIDISLVENLMSIHIIWFWNRIEPLSVEMRERLNAPQIDVWKEYLYNEMTKREEKRKTSKTAS